MPLLVRKVAAGPDRTRETGVQALDGIRRADHFADLAAVEPVA